MESDKPKVKIKKNDVNVNDDYDIFNTSLKKQYEKAILVVQNTTAIRKCLSCLEKFRSESKFNRMCYSCKLEHGVTLGVRDPGKRKKK